MICNIAHLMLIPPWPRNKMRHNGNVVPFCRKCKAADSCRGNCGQRPSPEERESCPGGAREERRTFAKLAEREEEEARYAKFVYDITQEIVQNGLYTDRELKEVFEKHLERNSGRLSKVLCNLSHPSCDFRNSVYILQSQQPFLLISFNHFN